MVQSSPEWHIFSIYLRDNNHSLITKWTAMRLRYTSFLLGHRRSTMGNGRECEAAGACRGFPYYKYIFYTKEIKLLSICFPKEIRSFTDVDFKPFFFSSGTECFPSINGSRLVQLQSLRQIQYIFIVPHGLACRQPSRPIVLQSTLSLTTMTTTFVFVSWRRIVVMSLSVTSDRR